jgi:UDP:flavonoid glycosyltransferase YjiC (YdhE family)
MKVLVTVVPQAGHVYPLLPLTRALVEQGDDVVLATGPDAMPLAAESGARVTPVGKGFDAWWQALSARTRGVPGDGLAPERVIPYFLPRLFAEAGTVDMVDDLLALAKAFEPDIIVHDGFTFAAPLVAALLGVQSAHHTIGAPVDVATLETCADVLSPLWRSMGRDVPPFAGIYSGVTVDVFPPSLGFAFPAIATDVRPMRPTPLPIRLRDAALPPSLAGLPERPIVYGTLGTMSNTDMSVFRAILDGLADEPVNVVLTVGSNNDPAALSPVPANARVERFVPQATLLPHCSAVVHHAGSGTMLGALAHRLPQLAIPQGADNFVNARLLESAGAGLLVPPGEVTAERVRGDVRAILDDARYRASASRVGDEIAGMPSPPQVAASLRR